MTRTWRTVATTAVLVVATAGCTSLPASESGPGPAASRATTSTAATSPPTEVLFDGSEESLAAWEQAGPGGFTLVDGAITSQGGMGLLWYAERPFTDVVVELEWRSEEPTDNSGVFVALGDPGEDMLDAMRAGHEVQIYDADTGEPQKTGAIYDAQPADVANSRPAGEWNHERITVEGGRITVELNGEVVTEWTDPDGPHEGWIGLQNHSDADVVSFRDVRARPLD